jgi:hypothetical protein
MIHLLFTVRKFSMPLAITKRLIMLSIMLLLSAGIAQEAFSLPKTNQITQAIKHPVKALPHKPGVPAKGVIKGPAKPTVGNATSTITTNVLSTDLLKTPDQFLNKTVTFEGTFSSFSALGLDYKRAFRDSKDFISFLILRPDVVDHHIPMSELKLIYPRKKGDALQHLEVGDQIRVTGAVFSTALQEPWVDVSEVTILKKAKPDRDKTATTPLPEGKPSTVADTPSPAKNKAK